MSNKKQKLELTWIGKNNPEYDIANIEPRILVENPDLSNVTNAPDTENMIIHGDNLLALKALLPEYEGKVKCIYIDPPYNTGNAFEHYDDSVEHSTWLSLMKPRLELLRMLLHPEQGSIWISIDDDETHYLKVLCDEIFGRDNFVANVIWQKKHTRANDAKWFSDNHDHILVYANNKMAWKRNLLPRPEEETSYENPDNDLRGLWTSQPMQVKTPSEKCIYEIIGPTGRKFLPPKGRSWQFGMERYRELVADDRIWFGENGSNVPRIKKFLSEVKQGFVPLTIWPREEVGDNQEAKQEMKFLFSDDPFGTPKPERLLKRILELGTKSDDLVLDSFLGSGTTAAVAHKMGRKYIGIEMGEHAYTHCKVRLDKVIDSTDQGGISKAMEWRDGGGYKFFELAPSFIGRDEFGNAVIDTYYNDAKLVRAMCKLMNFTFAPSQTEYWKQGVGQGKNFLYVTTQLLTVGMVQQIAAHLVDGESLIIAPKKYEPGAETVDSRIVVRKIPQSVLKACYYGKKEYLLPIRESTIEEIDEEDDTDNE